MSWLGNKIVGYKFRHSPFLPAQTPLRFINATLACNMIKSTILALILALCLRLQCCYGDTIQMYYDGYLRVNGVNRGLIKTFSLKNAFNTAAAVSLAIHYEQDLIFIADSLMKMVRE